MLFRSRYDHCVPEIRALTGAEDGLVVNNCAGGLLLAMQAIASGGRVVVSRGELVEIGGGFRIPEVLESAGARLLEIGTTNRTRLSDYETALVTTRTLQDTLEIGGTVAARTTAVVTAPEAGFIERLAVEEGNWVSAGQLMLSLDADALRDTLRSRSRELERELRDYDRFLLEYEYQQRAFTRQTERLRDDLEESRQALGESRALFEIGSVSAADVRDAEEAVEDSQEAAAEHELDVEEAQALHRLSRQNHDDDIAVTREEIAELEERLADTVVLAPISGRVISVADTASTSGELIGQYETLLEIADTRNPVIETELEEQYVAMIGVGQPVAVEVAGAAYEGSVERVAQVATASGDGGTPTVAVDVAINATGIEILPGSSAVVEILLGQIDDAIVLPRGPYLTSGNRRYLYVVDDSLARRVEVEYGTVTDSEVQVVRGVAPGETVITSSYQTFVDYTTVSLGGNQ